MIKKTIRPNINELFLFTLLYINKMLGFNSDKENNTYIMLNLVINYNL